MSHPFDNFTNRVDSLECIGSPADMGRYLYPDLDQLAIRSLGNGDTHVIGYTHFPTLKHIKNQLFSNLGSVGEPRKCQHDIHWAVYQPETRGVEFEVEDYDSETLANKCRLKYPAIPILAKILEREE